MSPLSKLLNAEDQKPLSYRDFLVATNLNVKSLFENRYNFENCVPEMLFL